MKKSYNIIQKAIHILLMPLLFCAQVSAQINTEQPKTVIDLEKPLYKCAVQNGFVDNTLLDDILTLDCSGKNLNSKSLGGINIIQNLENLNLSNNENIIEPYS